MPSTRLFVRSIPLRQFADGALPVAPPLTDPPLGRVLNRQLGCVVRFPPMPGAYDTIVDTGAPITIIPRHLWRDQFRWQAGRDYDLCTVAGAGAPLTGQLLQHSYPFVLARLRMPMDVVGTDVNTRFQVERLIVQLPDTDGIKRIVIGLWGGFFEGRKLEVDRVPNSDDLAACLVW